MWRILQTSWETLKNEIVYHLLTLRIKKNWLFLILIYFFADSPCKMVRVSQTFSTYYIDKKETTEHEIKSKKITDGTRVVWRIKKRSSILIIIIRHKTVCYQISNLSNKLILLLRSFIKILPQSSRTYAFQNRNCFSHQQNLWLLIKRWNITRSQ